MRKIFTLFFVLLLCADVRAQVTVTGTSPATFANYLTLKDAFDAINAGSHQGALQLLINTNTIETATAVLNASGTGGSSYSSLNIVAGGTVSVTGNLAAPLIDLNGADNVTIDGLYGGVNALSFINTSTSSVGGTSTIRFQSDANDNKIRNCYLLGSNTAVTNYAGTVLFGASGILGNIGNRVDNCDIGASVAGTPYTAIVSRSGSASNSIDTISNNRIYDYFNPSGASYGVRLTGPDIQWVIDANKFYQTYVKTAVTPSLTTAVLSVWSNTISNNVIGYADATGGGKSTFIGRASFIGIYLAGNFTSTSVVSGNIITGVSVTSDFPNSGLQGIFSGIIATGKAQITNNIIGSATGTGDIVITATAFAAVNGITITSPAVYNVVSGNQVSGFSINNISADAAFNGIWCNNSGTFHVDNNIVGSLTTANAIVMGTPGVTTAKTTFNGYYNSGAADSLYIEHNVLKNIVINGAAFTQNRGIGNVAAVGKTYRVAGNEISAISMSSGLSMNSGFDFLLNNGDLADLSAIDSNYFHDCNFNTTGLIRGIYNGSEGISLTVSDNIISNINRTAAGATFGISIANYSTTSRTLSLQRNTVTDLNAALGTGSVTGIQILNASSTITTCNDNTLTNLSSGTSYGKVISYTGPQTITISRNSCINATGLNDQYGIEANVSGGSGATISANTIRSMHGKGNVRTFGIAASDVSTISENNISDIVSDNNTGFVNGIYTTSPTADTRISNNIIGNISVTNPNSSNYILSGISVNAYNASRTFSLINNTVSVTAGSGTYNSAAIYAAGTCTIKSYNNIAINNSNPISGNAVAYFKQTSVIQHNNTDRNIYYAGTPNPTHLIWTNGTVSDQTINRYRYRCGGTQENNSKTELTNFISTTTGDANYLHIAPAIASFAEAAAIADPAVTIDIDNQIRNAISPDIGADEYSGIVKDAAGPVISINSFVESCNGTRTITATITDATGIPLTGAFVPKIWYTKNGGVFQSAPGVFVSGIATNSVWNFAVDPATIGGGVTNGDVISYYIIAQDLVSPQANINAEPSGGLYADDVNSVIRDVTIPATYTIGSVVPSGTWLGVDNNWFDPANWCDGVPTSTSAAFIPSGLATYPIITSGNAMANSVTLSPGASVIVSGTAIFSLFNSITNNSGTFDVSSGTFEFAGTVNNFSGGVFVNSTVKNLKISSGSILGIFPQDLLKVSGNLFFGNVNGKSLTTNGNLTLLSSSAGTASCLDNTNNGANTGNSIVGNVSVERYIPASRKWRFLSVNTIAATGSNNNFRDNWMESQTPGTHNSPSGYGMWITDLAGVPGGFDSASFSPTIKWWDAVSQGYLGITDPGTYDMRSHPAYMTFVRGDRNASGSNATLSSTVLRTFGALRQGTTTPITVPAGSNYTAVGNPYASAINLKQLNYSVGGSLIVAVWDPAMGGNYSLGGFHYLASNGPGNNFRILIGGGSYPAGFNYIMNTIESGQAFFVQGTSTNRDISFTEVSKTATANNVFFAPAAEQTITGKLALKDNGGVFTDMDAFMVKFKSTYNTAVDPNDAGKMANTSENVSVKRGNALMAIEFRNIPDETDTVRINITGMRVSDYQWSFDLDNMDQPGRVAYLVDQFVGTSTLLDPAGMSNYNFSVTATAASYAADRFMIVFKPAAVLPVTFTSITAKRQKDLTASVTFTIATEINIHHYELQKSNDGNNFQSSTSSIQPLNNAGGSATYTNTDLQPGTGVMYYRVKAISLNGEVQYSRTVKIDPINGATEIVVSPNPVKDKTIHLQMKNQPAGDYAIQLMNSAGLIVYKTAVTVKESTEVKELAVGRTLPAGTYSLLVQKEGEKAQVLQVVIL